MSIQKFMHPKFASSIDTLMVGDTVWFKGKDVATALDYINTKQAIITNVDNDDKQPLSELLRGVNRIDPLSWNEQQAMFINESGLYSLILNSKKPEAKEFKHWVTSEVLPSIRKTGSYKAETIKAPQIKIMNETDLHYKVVNFIRKYFPHAVLIAGLGELQDTSKKRLDAYHKGYKSGVPDILILNNHKDYAGFAIELKTPTGLGRLSDNQKLFLETLENNNHKTLVSNDYDEVIMAIVDYMQGVRICCSCCNNRRCFVSAESLENHKRKFHRIA